MEMKCAGEIMMPLSDFPYIPYWFSLRQALAELEDSHPSCPIPRASDVSRDPQASSLRSTSSRPEPVEGKPQASPIPWLILVFSAQNQLLGIVRRRDILQGLRPNSRGKLRDHFPPTLDLTADPNLYRLSFSPEKAVQDLKKQIERPIVEFMAPIRATVDFNDPALLAIYLMIDNDLAFVPVVKDGQIAGIVYAEDALHEVMACIV